MKLFIFYSGCLFKIVNFFRDMILTMHVHDVIGDVYSVDVCKSSADKPTSFRDSLIFMGFGSFVTSQKLMVSRYLY